VKCPACADPVTVPGRTNEGPAQFLPNGLRLFALTSGVAVKWPMHACTSCGLVWSHLDAGALRRLVDEKGTPELLAELRHRATIP
jgi:hypothetical protein